MNSSYPSVEYLREVSRNLSIYLPLQVQDNVKPKREEEIRKRYGTLYSFHLSIVGIIRNIEVSHLLGMNEVVVPHIVEEYAELNYALRELANNLKIMKPFDSELGGSVTRVVDSFRVKDIGSMLHSDLKFLSEKFDLELDLKEWMQVYKDFKPSEEFLKRIGVLF